MATSTAELQSTTRDRILDAAFDAVQAFGLSRITVEDIAHRARLSRHTSTRCSTGCWPRTARRSCRT